MYFHVKYETMQSEFVCCISRYLFVCLMLYISNLPQKILDENFTCLPHFYDEYLVNLAHFVDE